MILHSPFSISSRLLPSLRVGDGIIQLTYSKHPGRNGRTRYEWTIDLIDGQSFTDNDLQSGCQGGTILEGFASLISYLCAASESYHINGWEGENANLFPRPVVEWAHQFNDELSMLLDIDHQVTDTETETGNLFIEE